MEIDFNNPDIPYDSWDDFCEKWEPFVRNVVRKFRLPKHEEDGLVNHILLVISGTYKNKRDEIDNLEAYFRKIIHNQFAKYLKEKRKRENIDPHDLPKPQDIKSPLVQLIDAEMIDQLKVTLERLHPAYKRVIELRYSRNMTYQQISEVLDLSISASKRRVDRAVRYLKELFHTDQEP